MQILLRTILLCSVLLSSGHAMAAKVSSWQSSYNKEATADYAGAAQAISQFLKHKQAGEYSNLRTAWLEYMQGNYSKSINYYKKAMQINPKSIDAKLGMVPPLMAQQRWKEAQYMANLVSKSSEGNYQAHIYLMAAEENKRQWQTLRKHAKQIVRSYPVATDAWVYLARAELNLGNTKAATTAYSHVLTRYPANYEASAFLKQ